MGVLEIGVGIEIRVGITMFKKLKINYCNKVIIINMLMLCHYRVGLLVIIVYYSYYDSAANKLYFINQLEVVHWTVTIDLKSD